jgi:CelD/BcsL family acetyltransferase involved in cellulose biosynthesis
MPRGLDTREMKHSARQPLGSMRATVPAVVGTRPLGVRFELVDRLESLREEWMELAEQGRNIFATWEFATSWWGHFGAGRRLLTVGCRDSGGELFAILPMYLWRRRPLRVMRFVGHGAGDILGPVCRPERNEDASRALRRLLEVAPWDWDVFVGENLPGEQNWPVQLGGHLIRREGNPVLRTADGFDEFLAGQSSNFRQQIRARERRLARHYRIRYRLSDPTTLDAGLDDLFRLHEARFGEESAFSGSRAAFHRAFAHRALERGWLRLWVLELDDRPVAAVYGFRFGDVESYYQSGREPEFQSQSVGMVLLTHAVRTALDDGVHEFAFLRGHEPYKYRFATDDHGLDSVCLTQGVAASAALTFIQALRSSPAARKMLRGPLGM